RRRDSGSAALRGWRPAGRRDPDSRTDHHEGLLEPARRDGRRIERWLAAYRGPRLLRCAREFVYYWAPEGSHRSREREECLSGRDRVVLPEVSVHQGNLRDGAE